MRTCKDSAQSLRVPQDPVLMQFAPSASLVSLLFEAVKIKVQQQRPPATNEVKALLGSPSDIMPGRIAWHYLRSLNIAQILHEAKVRQILVLAKCHGMSA